MLLLQQLQKNLIHVTFAQKFTMPIAKDMEYQVHRIGVLLQVMFLLLILWSLLLITHTEKTHASQC
ncbi:unnamed protein product [Caenorhabditis brenneri]